MSENNQQNENVMNGGDAVTTEVENTATTTSKKETAEKIYSLEELSEEKEYSEAEFQEMFELYDQTMSEFVEGELIVGKILAVNDKEVAVDIGFKSEGVIPIDEFNDPSAIKVGENIEVYLDNVEDSDGQLVLSKRKADFLRMWAKVIDSHENDDIIEGTCVRRIKGGMVVDLDGVDAFLPGSQIDVRPIRDFDALIGQTMEFKIVKVNEARKNIVVSHRVLVEEGMKEQRGKILEQLERGQVLEGNVKNITDFGVFIDLGGVDGLLHINDLSWGRVGHPSEVVSLDEKIKVQVLDFNEVKDRISLGLKQLLPHPWDNVKDKYSEGDIIHGKVVNIAAYGAFIELEKGVEGLIHISEMSWTQHVKHPSKLVSLGEIIDAKILNIDHEGRKVSLGLKQLEPDPWEDTEAKYPVDSKQHGVVRNLTNFGAFVELEEGIDGLIHISDLSWTKKVRHPGEVIKKGDEVEVMVLNIDKDNRRISLGYKQTMDNPWETLEDTYKPESRTKGKIVRMIEKGVIVELPEIVDGFVPLSQLKQEGLKKPADAYQVGDDLELAVIEFNKENKKIILSEKYVDSKELKDIKLDDDLEAIAEYEKEMSVEPGVQPKPDKKAKAKSESEVDASAADIPADSGSDSITTEDESETVSEEKVEEEVVAEPDTRADSGDDSKTSEDESETVSEEKVEEEVVAEPDTRADSGDDSKTSEDESETVLEDKVEEEVVAESDTLADSGGDSIATEDEPEIVSEDKVEEEAAAESDTLEDNGGDSKTSEDKSETVPEDKVEEEDATESDEAQANGTEAKDKEEDEEDTKTKE